MDFFEAIHMQPWACLLIFIAVFIAVIFITTQIDWGKVFRKESQTQFMGVAMTIIVTLVITFAIGSLIIFVGGSITSLIQG